MFAMTLVRSVNVDAADAYDLITAELPEKDQIKYKLDFTIRLISINTDPNQHP